MLQSMHSQLFVVLLYPPAGSGCCRISCRYSLVLRKMPGIDGAGSQYKTNWRAPAVAGSHASSTYAGLIRGYMDVTLSHAHNMPEALCMPDSHGHLAFGIN